MSPATIQKQIEHIELHIKHAESRVAEIKERFRRVKTRNGDMTKQDIWELEYIQAEIASLNGMIDDLKNINSTFNEGAG